MQSHSAPLFYDADGRRCIGLGDYMYIESDMHQSYRTVVCVLLGGDGGEITELDEFLKKPVAVDAVDKSMTLKETLVRVVAARRGLERKIEKKIEAFHRDKMLMWLRVAQEFEAPRRTRRLEEIRRARAMRTIETSCVRAISDPAYRMCRQRLLREYAGLMT